jgi:hypothetical protein
VNGGGFCGRRQRNCRYRSAKRPVRDIEQMLVVREEQNLGLLREFVQDPEARCRALVIEVDDRDRGEPRGSSPPTPPYVRVRIRRFEKLR